MVKFSTITQANLRFAANNAENTGLVLVFSRATSSIGSGILETMATMFHSSTFYILGRSSTKFQPQREKLEKLNPILKLVFLEAEVSLIRDIDAACKTIKEAGTKVDYLCMSQGCFSVGVPNYTKEHLDTCLSLQYYSRMRLTQNLLPLLRKSPRPRVLNVLNADWERKMLDSDIGLSDLSNYSIGRCVDHTTTLMTLGLEYLAENNNEITFLHTFPGLVSTSIFTRLKAPGGSGVLKRALVVFLSRFVSIVQWVLGKSVADCGARQAWVLTTDKFGPGELWRLGKGCQSVDAPGVLVKYREDGWKEKVWEHTEGVFEKALETGK